MFSIGAVASFPTLLPCLSFKVLKISEPVGFVGRHLSVLMVFLLRNEVLSSSCSEVQTARSNMRGIEEQEAAKKNVIHLMIVEMFV